MHMPWLSLAIWVPILFGVVTLLLGRSDRDGLARWVALLGAIVSFLITIPLIAGFNGATAAMQFVEQHSWLPSINASYALGVDGLSVWFIPLTAFITVLVVLAGWEVITNKVAQYNAAFLILSGLMVGVFGVTDGFLFYIFFEATLIPMYIIVGVWGGPNRVYAAFKFFLYTLMGSLLMLIAIAYLRYATGTFDIAPWQDVPLPSSVKNFFSSLFSWPPR